MGNWMIGGGGSAGGNTTGGGGAGAGAALRTTTGAGAGGTICSAVAVRARAGANGAGPGTVLGAGCGAAGALCTAGGGVTALEGNAVSSRPRSTDVTIAMVSAITPATKMAVSELPINRKGLRRSGTSSGSQAMSAVFLDESASPRNVVVSPARASG